MPSRTQEYPKWSDVISGLPARWRPALNGSVAKLVAIGKNGYIIDVNDFDDEAFAKACRDDGFREELCGISIKWALNHPAGRPRICEGIAFGQGLSETIPVAKELGATLWSVTPKKYPRPNQE